MIKTRADQIKPGDVIDFDQHRYYTVFERVADETTETMDPSRKATGQMVVVAVEVKTYKTTSSFRRNTGSRMAMITYEDGRRTCHNFSEKLPVLS